MSSGPPGGYGTMKRSGLACAKPARGRTPASAARDDRRDRGAPPQGFLSRIVLTQPSPRAAVTFM